MSAQRLLGLALACLVCKVSLTSAQEPSLRGDAEKALRKAVDFFRKEVAVQGGYLWRYSDDLKLREGEGKATPSQAWVQPPGTPAVGLAFLGAFEATTDLQYLDAARETAEALLKGQLRSGGWDYVIEFDPGKRKVHAYRADGDKQGERNTTTLDDNNTQSAIRFLMRLDQVKQFKDAALHDGATYALESLLKAQYPNGAWPQRFDRYPDPAKFPVKKASFPENWSRTWEGSDYRGHYTFNDSSLADVIEVMLEAERIYGEDKYRSAARRGADFILLAQMPDPQPAWAQQYDVAMHPAWARKFEPPAVTGGESQRIMRALMMVYRTTGDKKYLEPIPRAVDYLKKSALPDGRLARFYELKTNKPLYFTKDYQLTFKDDDLPTHYAFKVASNLDAISQEYERLKSLDPAELKKPAKPGRPQLSDELIARTRQVIKAQDERGRWVEEGRLRNHGADDSTRRIISCETFIRNVGILSQYLAASRP